MQAKNNGAVLWISGLAGSGKTTIAKTVATQLKRQGQQVVLLDGDVLRTVFANDLGYSFAERKIMAYRYANLAKMLAEQGIIVVTAVIACIHEIQQWNRENIPGYFEVFIKVPIQELLRRDKNKLYSQAISGQIKNVVGVDIKVEEPLLPDCIIKNYDGLTIEQAINSIIAAWDGTSPQEDKIFKNC